MASHPVTTLLARYAAPGLAAIALVLVMGGDSEPDADLHVIVAPEAAAGELLPMRALVYTKLHAIDGPELRVMPVDVELTAASGRVLARTQLRPAHAQTSDMEGLLQLPASSGTWKLRATARLGDERVLRASSSIQVRVRGDSALPEPVGRSVRALQQFAAGPILPEPGQVAPASVRVQVRGGACVPEQPCRALVHVGAPAAAVQIEANSTVTPAPSAARASRQTEGIVPLTFTTHGPEAELWLLATRGGKRVARRAIRLPIAMAGVGLELEPLVASSASAPRLRVTGVEGGCIVDAFDHGAWTRTGSLASCAHAQRLPFPALGPGVHRIQVRRDTFSAQTAGVALLDIDPQVRSTAQRARELALQARRIDPDDPVVSAVLAGAGLASDPGSLPYLAALLEAGIVEPPTAVTGYAQLLAAQRARQTRLRTMALIALGLGGLALALSVGRKGLFAGARARRLLAFAGDDPGRLRRARLRSLLLVTASVASLLLVFSVIALYVLARGAH